jgi:hypothetical protein
MAAATSSFNSSALCISVLYPDNLFDDWRFYIRRQQEGQRAPWESQFG